MPVDEFGREIPAASAGGADAAAAAAAVGKVEDTLGGDGPSRLYEPLPTSRYDDDPSNNSGSNKRDNDGSRRRDRDDEEVGGGRRKRKHRDDHDDDDDDDDIGRPMVCQNDALKYSTSSLLDFLRLLFFFLYPVRLSKMVLPVS
mmetsp:Transcript_27396/g.65770  ORF Transcript_27396/g.65770 Transcript_27396/m.65770 type:complete len:144 (+) Transcript_27396:341-772(+)